MVIYIYSHSVKQIIKLFTYDVEIKCSSRCNVIWCLHSKAIDGKISITCLMEFCLPSMVLTITTQWKRQCILRTNQTKHICSTVFIHWTHSKMMHRQQQSNSIQFTFTNQMSAASLTQMIKVWQLDYTTRWSKFHSRVYQSSPSRSLAGTSITRGLSMIRAVRLPFSTMPMIHDW